MDPDEQMEKTLQKRGDLLWQVIGTGYPERPWSWRYSKAIRTQSAPGGPG